ncbi:MAG TPA: hypothetical protein VD994_19310 [Prosthecobacter sp.]|nr:hypothetical protein [Prosthecobacter sp.]
MRLTLIQGIRTIVTRTLLLSAAAYLVSCQSPPAATPEKRPSDFSGAARLRNGQILFVHDAKPNKDRAGVPPIRAGVVNPKTGLVRNVEIQWPASGVSSDLEAVCTLPGTGDILLCESGYYVDSKLHQEPQYGRIFRCRPRWSLQGLSSLKVIDVWHWPKLLPNGELTKDIEGVACVKAGRRHLLIAAVRTGAVFYAPISLSQAGQQLRFGNGGEPIVDIERDPRFSFLQEFNRKVSDLTLNSQGELCASAAFEDSDYGPFKSAIYKLGSLTRHPKAVIRFAPAPTKARMDGYKVEAMASTKNNQLFVGTDDEEVGGTWRVIPEPR